MYSNFSLHCEFVYVHGVILSHTYYVHVYKNGCLSIATDEQFLLHRLANAAIDIYGMAAVISRYIKSMKIIMYY